MGLDIWMEKKCDHCNVILETDSIHLTYNVSGMWYLIYPDSNSILDIDDCTGESSIKKLKEFLCYMNDRKSEMESINPENGWGSYDTFKSFISKAIKLAENHPDWTWKSWR